MIRFQRHSGNIDAHMNPAVERHPLGDHLFDTPVNVMFFHLEIRDAEPKQTACGLILFI